MTSVWIRLVQLLAVSLLAEAWVMHPFSRRLTVRLRRQSSTSRQLLQLLSSFTSEHTPTASKQTVAVVGSGAIGCYYGARLWEAGHDVKFLLRSDFDYCRTNGMNVTSILGNLHISSHQLQAFNSTCDMGQVDWVLVCVKSTSFDDIPQLIRPLLNVSRTRVMLIMNGLELEEILTKMMGPSFCRALYGGMAFICANRLGPGHVDHTFAGLLAAGRHFGCSCSDDSVAEDQAALEQLWEPTKVDVAYDPVLLRGRWKKMLWNLPFNGISVAMGGITVDQIVGNASLRKLAKRIMQETLAIANADLEARVKEPGIACEPFTDSDMDAMMSLSDNMDFAYKTSTMLDLTFRKPMEVRFLFETPLERAKELGVAAPCLETIVAQIEGFQSMYGLYS
ncbi:hypothetical protein MPSEU_000557700 [Mayamaea pseudoterrestris]|nr:hypothetical protein MPSEU_000557700 [Mayamaea pseudoterrestris]